MNSHFCLVFTAPAKWRVELRVKIGQYRNRCFDDKYHETDIQCIYVYSYYCLMFLLKGMILKSEI